MLPTVREEWTEESMRRLTGGFDPGLEAVLLPLCPGCVALGTFFPPCFPLSEGETRRAPRPWRYTGLADLVGPGQLPRDLSRLVVTLQDRATSQSTPTFPTYRLLSCVAEAQHLPGCSLCSSKPSSISSHPSPGWETRRVMCAVSWGFPGK